MTSYHEGGIAMPVLYDKVEASAPSRVHFGLLDCGNSSGRSFGGAGAVLDCFRTVVRAERTEDNDVSVVYDPHYELAPDLHMSERAKGSVWNVAGNVIDFASKVDKLNTGVRLTILRTAPEHMGLGSKNSLEMAVAYALGNLLLAREDYELTHTIARSFSGRGGTSRIGVLACEMGGFILDDGHPEKPGERIHQPSARRQPIDQPIANGSAKLDSSFGISLHYDPETPRIDGQVEADLFTKFMPFPDIENLAAIGAAYHGVLSSLKRKDMGALSVGLRSLNSVALKAREVEMQTDKTRSWLQTGWELGIPVGLSSFGPVVYSIGRHNSQEMDVARSYADECGLVTLGEFGFENEGIQLTTNNYWRDVLDAMNAAYDESNRKWQSYVEKHGERHQSNAQFALRRPRRTGQSR